MPNAVKWITNVGKSIGYSAIDQMKELNPTVTAFIDDNGDFGKSLYNTVKFKSLKESGNKLSENQYFKLAKDTIDNLKEDIRTGKLYNKEREEKAMDSAVNEYLGFDDSDFGFDDGDIDFGFDDDSDDIDEATKSINRTADIVGEKSSMAISKALVGSSEFIVKSNRQNTKTLFDQNNILYSKIHTDMSNINTNIGSIIEFAKDAAVPHFNNSSTFYTTMTSKIEETNSLLKELVDIQKELYAKKEEYGSSNGRKFSDITGAQGTPIIQSYIDMVKGNIKNNSYLDLLNMGMEMGVGASISSNPGKFITDFLVKAITPKMIKESMKDFNESLSGVFANIMLKLSTGDGLISEIFGIDNTLKTRLSPSQYNKGAVPFDGITRKSITEVIPTYLAKILAAVSNQRETRYDYTNGKFVTMDEILQRTRDITNDNARYAFSDIRYKMMDNVSRYDFDEKDNGKFITKKQFEKNLNEFFLYQYKNGKVFSDRKGNLDASTYGLSGGAKAEISAKIIQDMWKSLPKKDKLNVAKEILSRRESQTNDMLRREREGDAVELAIFNESTKAFKGDKNKSNYDPLQVATKYNSSILNVLVDIRKEVSYIRQYGFKQGRKKVRGKGKLSNNFDKFTPYEIEKEDIYDDDLGNFSSYDVVKRKEDDEIDKYLEETASEIRQEEARKGRIKKQEKKGPVEAFLSIFTNNKIVKDTAESIDNVLLSPAKFIKSVLDKADNAMYDLVFGREGDNDPNHAGILKKFGEGIKNTFDNINIWLNENIFNPLKEKFTKENIKGAVKKFFGIFGVDIEAIGNKVKQTLFGIKDAEGKRIKDGMFGGFVDSVKKDFSDVFGWGKKTVKDAVNATGVKGELNEKGKAKEERKNKASDMIKKLQEEKKKLDEAAKSNTPPVEGQAATGFKRVPKTGVYALSEGEAVIPPDYNPANIRKRYRNEQKAIDNYKKHGGINMLGEGSDPDVSKEAQKGWKDKKGSKYNDIDARIAKLQEIKNRKYEREDYEDLPLYYKMADQARAALGQFTKGFFGDIFDKFGNVDESKVKTNVTEMTDRLLGSAKEHLPEITTGAILGAGTSLITGMIGGPLLGAAVGSAVGLTIKSEEVQKLLFGNYDEDSKEYKGGLLPSKVSKAINKYAPTMAKGGTLGAITAIMPFVPGGPIAGLLVGSAAGFAIKNDKIQDYLFGEQGKLKGLPEKLKSALPKMGLGAIAGLAVGPFGVATNMILGSAIGFATDTNKFKDIFFGEEDKNGNRHGGIYDRIVSSVTKPVKNFLKENADYFTKWFQETIKKNVIDFFNPVKRRLRDLGKSIVNIFDRMGKKFTTALKESVLNRFFGVLEKFINPLNTLYKGLRGLVTGTVGLPFKLIGNIGRRMQASDVRRGKADYLKTAEERLDYRKNNKVSKLFRKDKALGTDKAINDMNSDELDLMLKSVKTLKDGGKSAESQYRETRNKLSTDILRSNLNRDDKRNIVELLKNNDFDGIRQYVSNPNIGINNTNKAYINSLLDSSEQQIKNSKFVMDKFKNGEERSALESLLKERGIDVKNIKLDDVEKYLSNELEARKGKEEENKDKVEKDEAKQWRNDLYDRIKEANDSLLHIANFLDPKFKGSEEQQKQLENYQMGKAADNARQTNYEERDRKDLSDEDKKENEQRRLDAANTTDEAKAEKRRDKLNDKAEKQKDKRDFEDAKKVDPSIGVNPLKRAMMVVDDFKDSVREGKKYFLDELNGYNDNENISKFGRIKNLFKQEIFEESVETQFYNGMPIKMYRDQAGNIQPDKSDSETVQTLKERDEDRETQKGILSNLKDIPSKIGEFLGFGKDKKEKKENLLSKIMKTAFKAALVTAGVGIFAKKIWPIIKKPLVEFKDGLLEGLFGKSDGEGGLANVIGEKIGEGARYITDFLFGEGQFEGKGLPFLLNDKIIPGLMGCFESLMQKVVPKLVEMTVKSLPEIVKGLWAGIKGLGKSIINAITFRSGDPTDNYAKADTISVESIGGDTNTGDVKYTPSSSWDSKDKISTYVGSFDDKVEEALADPNNSVNVEKVESGSTSTSNLVVDVTKSDKTPLSNTTTSFEDLKAYKETATNRISKVEDQVNNNLNQVFKIDGKEYTLAEILNSDTIVAGKLVSKQTGETTDVYGYQLLNNPQVAADYGFDTYLSAQEREEQSKKYGLESEENFYNISGSVVNSIMSPGSGLLSKVANSKPIKIIGKGLQVGEKIFDNTIGRIPIIGTVVKGAKNLVKVPAKAGIALGKGLTAANNKINNLASQFLPESLVGNNRKSSILVDKGLDKIDDAAVKAFNLKNAKKKIATYIDKFKDMVKGVIKDDSFIMKACEFLGVAKSKVTKTAKAISNAADDIAKELANKMIQKTAGTAAEKFAQKAAGFIKKFGILAIAEAVYRVIEGFHNADNIASILTEDVDPLTRVVSALVNVINNMFIIWGLIDTKVVFNVIMKGLSFLSSTDLLSLEEKQKKAADVLSAYEEKTGTKITLEEYNNINKYADAEYNILESTAMQMYGSNNYDAVYDYVKNNASPTSNIDKKLEEKKAENDNRTALNRDFLYNKAKEIVDDEILNPTGKSVEELLPELALQYGIQGQYADGTSYVPRTGLYALSKGEYVGRIPMLAEGTVPENELSKEDKIRDYIESLKDAIIGFIEDNTVAGKIITALNVSGNRVENIKDAISSIAKNVAINICDFVERKLKGKAFESLFRNASSMLRGNLITNIFIAVKSFIEGYRNPGNILNILDIYATQMHKVVAGIANGISETFIPYQIITGKGLFNIIKDAIQALTGKDVFEVDPLRNKSYEVSERFGISTEDLNNNYSNQIDHMIETGYGGVNGSFYDGTFGVPRTGLYALSKGEYVGRIPMLAEGTVGYNSILNNIKDNTQLSTVDVEDSIQKMYDYANTGDNKLFTSYENATNSTIRMLNTIGKKVFAPVYAIQKMQSHMQDMFQNESGNGLRIYETFEKELDNTNSYLDDTASMKEYWNTSLKNNDTLYGTMTDVMTTMHKVLMYPVIMSRKMFESMANALGSPLNTDNTNINNSNTSNTSSDTSTSSSNLVDFVSTSDSNTDSTSTTSTTTNTTASKTVTSGYSTSITGFNKKIDNVIINSSGMPLIYYKDDNGKLQVYKKDKYATRYVNSIAYTGDGRVVLKYSDKSVIVTPFKDPKKVPGLLASVIYKYSNNSTSSSFGDWLKGKANAQQQYLANKAKGSGSGLYIGRGTYDLPEILEEGSNSDGKSYNYTSIPTVKSLSESQFNKLSFNNITSTGDNFVSQSSGNISNTKFNTSLDSINQKVSDSGCAPAVATMVINSLRGKSTIDMNTAVKDALPYKVPNSGVTSTYFDDEFSKYGIATDYIDNNYNNTDKSPIIKAIKEQRPTILLGQDSSNNSKKNSPFGSNPHYVVADSISEDGKYIYINDPESKTPKIKYLIKNVLPKVKVGITTYIGRKARQAANILRTYVGGARNQVKAPSGDFIGKNTKQFESGNKGPKCIVHCGNDGGLSYGSYQMIWSGSAQDFWNKYFSSKYGSPSSYNDLKTKWLKAVEDLGEDGFFAKEWEYVLDNYYKAAVSKLKAKGFNPDNYSRAMQDCVWSWAVHRGAGGCASEFGDVIAKVGNPSDTDEITLINACYDVRAEYMRKVGWSSVATNRYGTGSSSERAVILGIAGKDPIDYTAPDGALSSGSTAGADSSSTSTTGTTGGTEYRSILDILLAPFDTLGSQYGLTGGTQTISGGTTTYNADGISGTVSSDPAIAEKQVKVVAQMNSVYGKLKYAQDNAKYPGSRNPDDGSGDCSSTVQWAYNKALGVDVGSWSGDQAASSNTYLVDGGRNGAGKTDESKLQLGDILLYGTDAGAHAEMYFGNGKVLTHGNPDKLGPTTANINRRSDYWGTKRLNEFKSSGTTNFNSSSNNTTSTSNNKTTLKDSFSKIGSAIFNKAKDTLKKNTGSGSGLYVGSGSFVSQLDPKYANMKFNIPGDTQNQTIGDSGCAPAAATMVLNDIYGNGSGMLDSAKLALKYKQNNDGVSSDYFQDIYSRNGLNANYYNRKEQVANDLRQGKDVVLLGSDKKNTSKNNSPFGPNPHYVVASGMSKDGKSITIKDPESKSPKKYNTKKILDNTKLGIGYGSALNSIKSKLRKYIGRGIGKFSGILYVGDSRTDMMKDCISEDGVYFIAKVSAGLEWLKGEAGTQTKAKIQSDPNLAVVFNFGVNDLYRKAEYVSWYTQFEKENPNANIFFMSVNPVDSDPNASDNEVQKFNETMKSHFGNRYLDVYSYLKSTGYKTTDGLHYDNATSKKIHEKVKEMLGGINISTSISTGTTTSSEGTSVLDRLLSGVDNLAVKYGLMVPVSTGNTSATTTNNNTTSVGPGSTYPTYSLTDSQLNDVATCITGETGGDDMYASMEEASQMANLNEVTYGRSNTGDDLYKTLHSGWYASASWTRGVTDTAKQAAISVLKEGKRTLPRYVTEHDTFPLDIENPKSRSEYKLGDPVKNQYGANYKFYKFFGKNGDGDISGYFQKDYDKYSGDTPWSVGSGSGLLNDDNTLKYNYNVGRASEQDVLATLSKYNIGSSLTSVTADTTSSTTNKDTISLLKSIIKLLAQIVDNTKDVSEIVEILSKIVSIQADSNKKDMQQDLSSLRSQLANKLNSYNRSNAGSGDLSYLMDSIETLAME